MASSSDDVFILKQCTSSELSLLQLQPLIVSSMPCHRVASSAVCDSGLIPRLGLLVGYYVTPVSCGGRVVYLTSHLFAIVLVAGYAGKYISFLSSGRPLVMPFTSLGGMLEDGSYRLGAMSRSAQVNYFDVRDFATSLIIYLPDILVV